MKIEYYKDHAQLLMDLTNSNPLSKFNPET
jgi:hypothetical protein